MTACTTLVVGFSVLMLSGVAGALALHVAAGPVADRVPTSLLATPTVRAKLGVRASTHGALGHRHRARTLRRAPSMQVESARTFFETLAARGQEPCFANIVGTLELDVAGSGTWTIAVDRGAVRVAEGPPPPDIAPQARIQVREDELVRLLRGDDHQNLFTAVLRGALVMEGDLRFVQVLHAIIPIPEDWRTS